MFLDEAQLVAERAKQIYKERLRDLVLSRLWFIFRWHHAAVDLIDRLCPMVRVQSRLEIA